MLKHILWNSTKISIIFILAMIYIPNLDAQNGDSGNLLPRLEPISSENVDALEPILDLELDSLVKDVAVTVDEEGYIVAVAANDVYIWNLSIEREDHIIITDEINRAIELDFGSDDHTLVVLQDFNAGEGGDIVEIYDLSNNEVVDRFGTRIAAWSFDVDHENSHVAVGLENGHVCIWDISSLPASEENCLADETANPYPATSVAYAASGLILAVGNSQQGLLIWDLNANTNIFEYASGQYIDNVSFDPKGEYLVYSFAGSPIFITEHGQFSDNVHELMQPSEQIIYRDNIIFTPDASMVIADDNLGGVWFWDVQTSEVVQLLNTPSDVESIAMSYDSKILVTGDEDGNIILWGVPQESTP